MTKPRTGPAWVRHIVASIGPDLAEPTVQRAAEIADEYHHLPHRPSTLAGAAVYRACEERGEPMTQALVADAVARRRRTIRNCVRALELREGAANGNGPAGDSPGETIEHHWRRVVADGGESRD